MAQGIGMTFGIDHGVGHPIRPRFRRTVLIYQSDRGLDGAGYHPEWQKVADVVIKAFSLLIYGSYYAVNLDVPHV